MRSVVPVPELSWSAREQRVRSLWLALPYQAYGVCASCDKTHSGTGRRLLLCGVNADSRVCLSCFEFEHDCRPPNYRRRASGRRRALALA